MEEVVRSPFEAMDEAPQSRWRSLRSISSITTPIRPPRKPFSAMSIDGKVSACLGTHTHVQTNDAKILPNGTAFMSDVGMCGDASNGVIGFRKELGHR
jgi:calcineurin-like phosphoesterase